MSRILGILNTDLRPADLGLLKAMSAKMKPESIPEEISIQGPAGFSFKLFQNGRLFTAGDEGLVILDGWIEGLRGAEQIWEAYRREGADAVKHFSGDFAFALWDNQKKKLLLARDLIGIKPFYTFFDGRQFLFCSAIEPFFALSSLIKSPDESMLADYLAGEFRDSGKTFFQNIAQLKPGHYLTLEPGRAPEIRPYAELHPKTMKFPGEKEYLQAFREIFLKAIRKRLSAGAPSGILLSGGLDSTQVAACAETLRLQDKKLPELKAATLLMEGFPQEEWEALENLKEKFGLQTEAVRFDSTSQSAFEIYLNSGETLHPQGFMTIPALLQPLRAAGCRTVLTGIGATEIENALEFGYLQDRLLSLNFPRFWREVNAICLAAGDKPSFFLPEILKETARELAPAALLSRIRRKHNRERLWLNPRMREKLPGFPKPKLRGFHSLSKNLIFRAVVDPSLVFALNQMDDLVSRSGIEISHPFLDREVIEFFLNAPDTLLMKWGFRKMFVQKALEGIVPGPFRTKDDRRTFIPDLDARTGKQLETQRLKKYLSNRGGRVYHYVDFDEVQNFFSAIEAERSENWRLHLSLLWRIASLERWLTDHF